MKHKIIVAITGASGSIYAKVLLDQLVVLKDQTDEIGIVMSKNAKDVWEFELGNDTYKDYPFASGSAQYKTMIVVPCSMGTLARIATGVSDDLITRAADVILKERRKLILVSRDTPLNLIHINNMKIITEAGGIIMPASPSFYSKPKNYEELAATVINRVIDLADLKKESYRWQS